MKKLVKKMAAVILSAVLIMGIAISSVAAPSPNNTGIISGAEPVNENGEKLNNPKLVVEVSTVPAKYAEAVAMLTDGHTVNDLVAGIIDPENIAILDVRDIEAWMTDGSDVPFPLTVKVSISQIKKSTVCVILHYNDGKGAWERIPTTVYNGYVIATFSSLSPIAVIVDKTTLDGKNNGTTPVTDPTSKTGDETPLALIIAVAALSLGAVICLIVAKKKSRRHR